ncbi:response regulator [uncultured Algibacter sp.]|uniref:response regulator n=1 Tax=uncultured Algibacter sp. TaxID=298659 RepID=UPI0032171950
MKLPSVNLACIIDDDNVYVNLVKKIIETKKLCKNLMIFSDGKESIDYFEALLQNINDESSIPEIIFLDLNMPVMDGWQFLERFTKIKNNFNKTITLYVVSSSINPIDINRAKSLNSVADYLIKPIRINELKAIFEKSA